MPSSGLVSQIQRYCTKDGPGIRSTVFLMGCNLRCVWCSNPETWDGDPQLMVHKNRCQHCGQCVKLDTSLTMLEDGPMVDRLHSRSLPQLPDICPYDVYECCGEWMTVDEVCAALIKDEAYYRQSHGGVTFSGGEPLLQADFVTECLAQMKRHKIATAIDTAGLWDWEEAEPALQLADLILFDLKAYASDLHRQLTGVLNEQILANAQRLAAAEKPLIIRMVLAEGLNTQPEDLAARFAFIRSLGTAVRQVDLLELHHYGEGKYERLGIVYPLKNRSPLSEQRLLEIVNQARAMGLRATIGG